MIDIFMGLYRWLSNFEEVEIQYNNSVFPTTEHAYQAQKNDDPGWLAICSCTNTSPGEIKRLSRSIEVRDNWFDINFGIMLDLQRIKFSKEPYRSMLIGTGTLELIEGNHWGDLYWGIDLVTRIGQNQLGKILMKVRTELKAEDSNKEGESND